MSDSQRPVVLVSVAMPDELTTALHARYEVLGPLGRPFSPRAVAMPKDDAARVRALVTMGMVDTKREAIDALPALGMIGCLGSGYEGVDLAAARERGIAVTHSPGANAAAVADLALGLAISSVRNIAGSGASLRAGDWERRALDRTILPGLTGRRMGIYGLGVIGEKIARRAQACEMEIGYHNRRARDDVPYRYFASLGQLAEWADVLMVSVRASAGNRHAVDAGILRALGPEGHVINIARGSVIDETALIEALNARIIGGAGLDVFESEPVVPPALRAMPHVVLTPHIGSDTAEAGTAMARMVLDNLEAFFAGRPVVTPVP